MIYAFLILTDLNSADPILDWWAVPIRSLLIGKVVYRSFRAVCILLNDRWVQIDNFSPIINKALIFIGQSKWNTLKEHWMLVYLLYRLEFWIEYCIDLLYVKCHGRLAFFCFMSALYSKSNTLCSEVVVSILRIYDLRSDPIIHHKVDWQFVALIIVTLTIICVQNMPL